ncbi:hypothetical protein YC2023_066574 [Brassica napus]
MKNAGTDLGGVVSLLAPPGAPGTSLTELLSKCSPLLLPFHFRVSQLNTGFNRETRPQPKNDLQPPISNYCIGYLRKPSSIATPHPDLEIRGELKPSPEENQVGIMIKSHPPSPER